ncbi:MAG: flagellar hook-associated protein FlgK [Planctomycetota bacterium]
MGLFSSLGVGVKALNTSAFAIQTAGHNISNANTEGYARQRVLFQTENPQTQSFGYIGQGVSVKSVQRMVDDFLESDLRRERSTLEGFKVQRDALARLESMVNELTDTDLSSGINQFFSALESLSQNPSDTAARSTVIEQGNAFAEQIKALALQVNRQRSELNTSVQAVVTEINSLTTTIAQLNLQILRSERGDMNYQANDLRTQRDTLLKQLGDLVSVKVYEQANGTVSVTAGNDFLVLDDTAFALTTSESSDRNVIVSDAIFQDSGAPLTLKGGKLAGLVEARDVQLGGFSEDLDTLAQTFIFEFNKIHSEGVGLKGYSSLISGEKLTSSSAALSAAGLTYAPRNGSFDFIVRNEVTGEARTFNITVDLDGLGSDTSLSDPALPNNGLVQKINAAVGVLFPAVSARATTDNRLEITSDSANYTFAFGNDTSDILAAMRINTFFSGKGALDMAVSDAVADDPARLAGARSFNPADNTNVLSMIGLRDGKFLSNGASSFGEYYEGVISVLGVQAAAMESMAGNQEDVVEFLSQEREQFSGVNIDEEVAVMITLQRAYQGAARYIAIVDNLLDVLINNT